MIDKLAVTVVFPSVKLILPEPKLRLMHFNRTCWTNALGGSLAIYHYKRMDCQVIKLNDIPVCLFSPRFKHANIKSKSLRLMELKIISYHIAFSLVQ